jgi:hypothetical protein
MDCFGDSPPKSSEIHFCSIIHCVEGVVQVITLVVIRLEQRTILPDPAVEEPQL